MSWSWICFHLHSGNFCHDVGCGMVMSHEVMKCFEVLLTLHYKLSSCPVVPGGRSSIFHVWVFVNARLLDLHEKKPAIQDPQINFFSFLYT